MSILFTPQKLGKHEIGNRFVHSATYECMADIDGRVTDQLVKRYGRIARGGTGLIVPGYMFIMENGRAVPRQTGIYSDDMIEGLGRLVGEIHAHGSKVAFQLAHSGRQTLKTTIGQDPLAPSSGRRDMTYLVKPRPMSEVQIGATIEAFGAAAARVRKAGADGVQVHAAHGYLVNQFLSPFFNKRTDAWGGSDENRFRFLKEIILEIKRNISEEMFLLVKLNTRDFTPGDGITPDLAKKYASWLAELPVDGLEVSCGTLSYSMFNMVRGDVPAREIVLKLPWWKKWPATMLFKSMRGKFDLEEGYNLAAARLIKPVMKGKPLFAVGGLRTVARMEEALNSGSVDFISMSRPFIREPNLVLRIRDGKADAVSCVSCNKCFAAAANSLPVHCYHKGFPG